MKKSRPTGPGLRLAASILPDCDNFGRSNCHVELLYASLFLPGWMDDLKYCDEMSSRAGQNENVPDFMITELVRHKIEYLGCVNNGAECIDYPACNQPGQTQRRKRCRHLPESRNAQPAHQDINSGRKPARGIDIIQLDQDANQGDCPNNCQKSPAKETGKSVQTNWGICSRNQKIDGRMVKLS